MINLFKFYDKIVIVDHVNSITRKITCIDIRYEDGTTEKVNYPSIEKCEKDFLDFFEKFETKKE